MNRFTRFAANNVIGLCALFVALGGTTYAATGGRHKPPSSPSPPPAPETDHSGLGDRGWGAIASVPANLRMPGG